MGFKELKSAFEEYMGTPDDEDEKALETFTARALFEIAGNLDSIAVSMREQAEVMKEGGAERRKLFALIMAKLETLGVEPPFTPSGAYVPPGKRD